MSCFKYKITFVILKVFSVAAHYETIYIEDLCSSEGMNVLNLGSDSSNSSGILKTSRNSNFLSNKNCSIFLQPPLGYGVILSVRRLDFRPYYQPTCENYIRVHENNHEFTLCGYSDDVTEYQSYTSDNGALQLEFFTEEGTDEGFYSDVTFTITSYISVNYNCDNKKLFQCLAKRCIWKGLICDGHNNCGDQSDDSRRYASCGKLSSGAIAGITVGSVIFFLLLIIVPFACFKFGAKYRTEAIPVT
ncbi:uncharacterized protein LOC129231521 [Uloborus diversus]|uniref:uncharacterized protein LOC129231521 n=1 Tax=Uloborus diversus TaxID=327109 RepID=UPI0024098D71|nr:uncharacterized protein LOC129231521 [Uloborus diversus]